MKYQIRKSNIGLVQLTKYQLYHGKFQVFNISIVNKLIGRQRCFDAALSYTQRQLLVVVCLTVVAVQGAHLWAELRLIAVVWVVLELARAVHIIIMRAIRGLAGYHRPQHPTNAGDPWVQGAPLAWPPICNIIFMIRKCTHINYHPLLTTNRWMSSA